MNERDSKALARIIVHIDKIIEYTNQIHTLDDFNQNQLVLDAVVFNLTQIGEIAKLRVSTSLKEMNPSIPWHAMYGLRNRMVHDYDQINMNIVYDTVKDDIPYLRDEIIKIMIKDASK